MAKRITVVKDNNKIEIWDNELKTFEKKGFMQESSKAITKKQTLTTYKDKK